MSLSVQNSVNLPLRQGLGYKRWDCSSSYTWTARATWHFWKKTLIGQCGLRLSLRNCWLLTSTWTISWRQSGHLALGFYAVFAKKSCKITKVLSSEVTASVYSSFLVFHFQNILPPLHICSLPKPILGLLCGWTNFHLLAVMRGCLPYSEWICPYLLGKFNVIAHILLECPLYINLRRYDIS